MFIATKYQKFVDSILYLPFRCLDTPTHSYQRMASIFLKNVTLGLATYSLSRRLNIMPPSCLDHFSKLNSICLLITSILGIYNLGVQAASIWNRPSKQKPLAPSPPLPATNPTAPVNPIPSSPISNPPPSVIIEPQIPIVMEEVSSEGRIFYKKNVVFTFQNSSYVYKCGDVAALEKRALKHLEMQRLIEEKGWNHLVVPSVCLCKSSNETFVREKKLDITSGIQTKLFFYCYRDQLEPALLQLLELLEMANLDDMSYSNLPFVISNKGVQFALIDAEIRYGYCKSTIHQLVKLLFKLSEKVQEKIQKKVPHFELDEALLVVQSNFEFMHQVIECPIKGLTEVTGFKTEFFEWDGATLREGTKKYLQKKKVDTEEKIVQYIIKKIQRKYEEHEIPTSANVQVKIRYSVLKTRSDRILQIINKEPENSSLSALDRILNKLTEQNQIRGWKKQAFYDFYLIYW